MENSTTMVIELTINWQTFALVAVLLAGFGIAFNRVVDCLGDLHQGYTSLLVACGTLITLAGAAFVVGWVDALLVLALFVPSGAPMIAGEVIRTIRRRKVIRSEVTDGDETH